jgi:hypothetical protein
MTELLANYLGNYKQIVDNDDADALYRPRHNHDGKGPVIISSENFYSWGDLLTFRYIGESYIPISQDHQDHQDHQLHQPIEPVFPIHNTNLSAPIHLRYHTISKENPVTIIQDIDGSDTPAIIALRIVTYESWRYIVIDNYSDDSICINTYINTVETDENNEIVEGWIPTGTQNKFLLSSEPLLMFVIKSREQISQNPNKAFVMVIEASLSFDQNLPNPSEIALETFVANFIENVIDETVAQVIDISTNNNIDHADAADAADAAVDAVETDIAEAVDAAIDAIDAMVDTIEDQDV